MGEGGLQPSETRMGVGVAVAVGVGVGFGVAPTEQAATARGRAQSNSPIVFTAFLLSDTGTRLIHLLLSDRYRSEDDNGAEAAPIHLIGVAARSLQARL